MVTTEIRDVGNPGQPGLLTGSSPSSKEAGFFADFTEDDELGIIETFFNVGSSTPDKGHQEEMEDFDVEIGTEKSDFPQGLPFFFFIFFFQPS